MMLENKYLIDTTIWIEYFRSGKGKIYNLVDELLDYDRVVLCGIVEMEILQGVRLKERKLISDLFSALPYSELIHEDYINAVNQLNNLRNKGITIPSTDCLIGTLCIRNNYTIVTLDKHFDRLKSLKKYNIKF